MIHSKLKMITLFAGCWLLIAFSGCQKSQSSSGDMRRAQLVGNENLQLKKQLAEKDAQIVELNQKIESLQDKIGQLETMNADIYKGLMQNLLDCSTKLETYEKDLATN